MNRDGLAITMSPQDIADALGRPHPTLQQQRVITAPLESMLVIAGAGSGKTETIAQRVVYLVANRLAHPGAVLGLTFTRKAAAELAQRIRSRLKTVAAALGERDLIDMIADNEPLVSTYHSFAGQIINEFGPLVGIEPAATVLSPTAAWRLARHVVTRWDRDLDTDRGPDHVTSDVLSLSSALADHLVSLDEVEAELSTLLTTLEQAPPTRSQRGPVHSSLVPVLRQLADRKAVLPLVRAYQAAKVAASAVDFADQMRLAARIVGRSDAARNALRERHQVVLLDEYQDTGHAQRIILKSAFGRLPPPEAGGQGDVATPHAVDSPRFPAVTAVGDPVQSIYAWRGASASNLPRFTTDFPMTTGEPAAVIELLVSFRNDEAVLDVANAASRQVRQGPIPVGTLLPAPGSGRGSVVAAVVDTVTDEIAWLADGVADRWRRKAGPPPSIAVLVRRRAAMAPIAAALRDRGVPTDIVGIGGLISEPEVADVIAMMRMVMDHHAGPSAVRILTGARWRMGIADLAALSERARHLSARPPRRVDAGGTSSFDAAMDEVLGREEMDDAGLVDALADPGELESYSPGARFVISALQDELARLRIVARSGARDLVAAIVRTIGIDVETMLHGDGWTHLDALAEVVADLEAGGLSLVEVLDYLADAAEREQGLAAGEVELTEGHVHVLTVHAAKGLEWDVVAVPHLSAGMFPSDVASTWLGDATQIPPALRGDRDDVPSLDLPVGADQGALGAAIADHRKRWAQHHLIEERRLFYVAVTRARHEVLLSAHHWSATRKKPTGPGLFLSELLSTTQTDDAGGATPTRLVNVETWAPSPAEGAVNPLADAPRSVTWPVDPLGARRSTIQAGASLVTEAMRDLPALRHQWGLAAGGAAAGDAVDAAAGDTAIDDDGDTEGWWSDARDLLRERAANRRARTSGDVALPRVISVSTLLDVAADAGSVARRIRRPMPRRPSSEARRGTAFHAWVERYFGGEPLLDIEELPGAHDRGAAADERLSELIDAFQRSPWASRTPLAIEVPFVTHVAGLVVRGRIDAVFPDGEDGAVVVDWKTGSLPEPDRMHSVALQLTAYRLAWSRMTGTPLARVRAAFHYVLQQRTVTPDGLLDAAELERLITQDALVEPPSSVARSIP